MSELTVENLARKLYTRYHDDDSKRFLGKYIHDPNVPLIVGIEYQYKMKDEPGILYTSKIVHINNHGFACSEIILKNDDEANHKLFTWNIKKVQTGSLPEDDASVVSYYPPQEFREWEDLHVEEQDHWISEAKAILND